MRALVVAILLLGAVAHADPDPKRKVIVLEYRAGSSALQGIARRLVQALEKQTSLQVSNHDQTRIAFGGSLDQAILKCAGDAPCIAKIGQKVGAAEVVLVGISELGDVILTMQRIDVGTKEVSARIADSLPSGASPNDAQLEGYITKLFPPSDFLRYGVLDIVANLSGAAVTVGGESRGVTPIQPLKLHAPANYDIKVEKQGYEPFKTRVALPPDGEIKVEASLSRKGETAWYAHWYVLAGAGVVVAGLGGTAIYFGTRDTFTGSTAVHTTAPVH